MTIRKSRSKRFFVGPLIIVVALVSLVATGMKSNTLRAVPVNELRAADATKNSFVSQRLRVVGRITSVPVVKTPIQSEGATVQLARFSIEEKGKTLQVEYRDALPDTFRAGGPVQVDGVYVSNGVMQADHVLTKCPSKYESGKGGGYEKSPQPNDKTAALAMMPSR